MDKNVLDVGGSWEKGMNRPRRPARGDDPRGARSRHGRRPDGGSLLATACSPVHSLVVDGWRVAQLAGKMGKAPRRIAHAGGELREASASIPHTGRHREKRG